MSIKDFETKNKDSIKSWVIEYDIKPGFRVITYVLKDNSKHTFETPYKPVG